MQGGQRRTAAAASAWQGAQKRRNTRGADRQDGAAAAAVRQVPGRGGSRGAPRCSRRRRSCSRTRCSHPCCESNQGGCSSGHEVWGHVPMVCASLHAAHMRQVCASGDDSGVRRKRSDRRAGPVQAVIMQLSHLSLQECLSLSMEQPGPGAGAAPGRGSAACADAASTTSTLRAIRTLIFMI